MNFLLDTHVFLWCVSSPELLPERARNLILDPGSRLYVSAASIWELAIKRSLGRVRLDFDVMTLESLLARNGFNALPVSIQHAAKIMELPRLSEHKDPFDRILVAQSRCEPLILLTADSALSSYGETILCIS
jgi:PIN domain nuclease of toxin-antitoxin system